MSHSAAVQGLLKELRGLMVRHIVEIVDGVGSRYETVNALATKYGWCKDKRALITPEMIVYTWRRITCCQAGFHPLKNAAVESALVDVNPSIFESVQHTREFRNALNLHPTTSPDLLICAAHLLQNSMRWVLEESLKRNVKCREGRAKHRQIDKAVLKSADIQLPQTSPKIQDSIRGIDTGILAIMKTVRTQCETRASKDFPVDTSDYFMVVDHITKRLLPLITRLEASITAPA